MNTRNGSVTQFKLAGNFTALMHVAYPRILQENREYLSIHDHIYRLQDPPIYHKHHKKDTLKQDDPE